jgi:hypothetical protein
MTSDELSAQGRALYGQRWQTSLAQDLGVADRTLRRWLAGDSSIPDGVESEVHRILESRLKLIGGLVSYSVNLADRSVLHYPTIAYFRIEDGDVLNLLFDKLIPPDQRELVIGGARDALRRERERDPRIVGRWG